MIHCGLTNVINLLIHTEILIHIYSKIAYLWSALNHFIADSYWHVIQTGSIIIFTSKNNNFCFIIIEFEKIIVHPYSDSMNAWLHPGYNIIKIIWIKRNVELCIIRIKYVVNIIWTNQANQINQTNQATKSLKYTMRPVRDQGWTLGEHRRESDVGQR